MSDEKWDKLADYDLGRIANALERIAAALEKPQITDFVLYQINDQGETMPIQGTVAGTTSTFQVSMVPAAGFVPLQSGPAVTVDDTTVTITQPDAKLQITAAVPAGSTAASYNLTISGVNGAGTAVTHKFNIPVLAPTPVQVTDFGLNQLS